MPPNHDKKEVLAQEPQVASHLASLTLAGALG